METCSALNNQGIDDVWQMIVDYQKLALEHQGFHEKRNRQNVEWMRKLIHEMLDLKLKQNPEVKQKLPILQRRVVDKATTPYNAARQIVDML